MKKVGVGIIGCGNISRAYLQAMKDFPILDIKGLADINPLAARERAAEFGHAAVGIDDLLADPEIEIIVNLTIPQAHVKIARKALVAGKHTYSEKPLATTFAEGRMLLEAATEAGLRIGAAPDTFLGGGHQAARATIDQGKIGRPVGGSAVFMRPGHELWHPNPGFYYLAGGGPLFDMGPYYITDLINLLGPVARVQGFASMSRNERVIESEPLKGTRIPVEVQTHIAGTLHFANEAIIQLTMSFDVAAHRRDPIEIYGLEGTVIVPDPNRFGGDVTILRRGGEAEIVSPQTAYWKGNYRSLGVADMAFAIRKNRPHRANGALAVHVLEVMEAVIKASETGQSIDLTSAVERPSPLIESLVEGKLAS